MRIACVLAADFEDSEFHDPYEAFLQAGHEVTVIGLKANEPLKGKKGQVTVLTEKSFGDVSPTDFDALLIPGGYSPDNSILVKDGEHTLWMTAPNTSGGL